LSNNQFAEVCNITTKYHSGQITTMQIELREQKPLPSLNNIKHIKTRCWSASMRISAEITMRPEDTRPRWGSAKPTSWVPWTLKLRTKAN